MVWKEARVATGRKITEAAAALGGRDGAGKVERSQLTQDLY